MGSDYTKKAAAPAASAAPAPAAASALVRLTKDKPQVSLTKQTGQLRVNLNWNTSAPTGVC